MHRVSFLFILSLVIAGCTEQLPSEGQSMSSASSSVSSASSRDDFLESAHGTAYAEEKGDKSYAYLERYGEIMTMYESTITDPQRDLWGYSFRDFRFSESGRYVLFEGIGWEWMTALVFDSMEKRIAAEIPSPHAFDVTPDERRLFSCALNEFAGEIHGKVIRLDNGAELVDVVPQINEELEGDNYIVNIDCVVEGSDILFTLKEGSFGPVGDIVSKVHRILVDPEDGRIISKTTSGKE